MYGCESWTVTEEIKRRIEAFEMWCYRRLLKISWTDRITNLEVMRRVGVANKIEYQNICKKKLKLAEIGDMCKTLIEGAIERRKSRGRQRKMWMFNIKDWMKEDSYVSVKMRMKKRKHTFMVINVRLLNRIPSSKYVSLRCLLNRQKNVSEIQIMANFSIGWWALNFFLNAFEV